MGDYKDEMIDSMDILSGDNDISLDFEKKVKQIAYSILFGSKKMKMMGIKVEDGMDIRKNIMPFIYGKRRLLKNNKVERLNL